MTFVPTAPGGGSLPVIVVAPTGDGSTDDSGTIQAAINNAYNLGGGIVVVAGHGTGTSNGGPAAGKSTVVNSTLQLKAGVSLVGLGSTTVLTGSANPMIVASPNASQDRMAVRDMTIQGGPGIGVRLASSGAFQLGWPRVTVENVTCADMGGDAFKVDNSQIESRLINCVSLRAAGYGFNVAQTDNMLSNCTAGSGSLDGFFIQGGNNKLTGCKGYANSGNGFTIAGAGRHMLTSCESQDNVGVGYSISGSWNSLAGCLSDTDNIAGYQVGGASNVITGSAMFGGGGSGQVTKCGWLFLPGATQNVVNGVSNCSVPVGGDVAGNSCYVNGAPGSRTVVAYAATVTPSPYLGDVQSITLTGPITIAAPVAKHVGQRISFEFVQDSTGGRVVTFASAFRANWTPVTTGGFVNTITFEFDGRVWQQVGATGLPPFVTGVVDNFTRANGLIGTSSGGQVWGTYNQDGGATWNIASNQASVSGTTSFHDNYAVLDGTTIDPVVTITMQTTNGSIVWRYTDQNNLFKLESANTIRRVQGGVSTVIAAGVVNWGVGDVITVRCQGGSHLIYKNGVEQLAFADSFNQSATKCGMGAFANGAVASAFAIS